MYPAAIPAAPVAATITAPVSTMCFSIYPFPFGVAFSIDILPADILQNLPTHSYYTLDRVQHKYSKGDPCFSGTVFVNKIGVHHMCTPGSISYSSELLYVRLSVPAFYFFAAASRSLSYLVLTPFALSTGYFAFVFSSLSRTISSILTSSLSASMMQ